MCWSPRAKERSRYIEPSNRAGLRIVGIEFRIGIGIDIDIAIARNAQRVGKAKIPEKAIWATLGKLEPLCFVEGFDEVCWVIFTQGGIQLFDANTKDEGVGA